MADSAEGLDGGREAINVILSRGQVCEGDLAALRRDLRGGAGVSREEADALFRLERAYAVKCPEWTALFVEAITDHVVWQVRPTGILNQALGEWLIARADEAASLNAFAVLVNVLAEAHRVPLWFVAAVRARAARGWAGVDAARREALLEAA